MSKWDKPAKPVTQQFLQNEERRRQMIIQASKMRRQKLKKLEQLNQNIKKEQQQAIEKMKRQKQEANRYLKANNNMHDKYEQIRRNQKMQIQEQGKKEVSKWKKRDSSQNKNIDGGELEKINGKSEVSMNKNVSVEKIQSKKGMESKKAVEQQFQKQWADQKSIQEDVIGSKLLDSLDLDIDTMQRGRQLTNKIQKVKQLNNGKPNIDKNQVQQMKNLIGYDSMLLSKLQQPAIKPSINLNKNNKTKSKQEIENKETNQQEAFINLKHKKQGKLFNWANDKVQEADDLFSNCSSNKNLANKPINTKDSKKGSKKMLEPIIERGSQNKSLQKDRKSVEKPPQILSTQIQRKQNLPPKTTSNKSMQKFQSEPQNQNQSQNKKQNKVSQQKKRIIPQQQKRSEKIIRNTPFGNQNQNRNRSISKQKVKQNQQAAFQKQRQKSLQKIRDRRYSGQRTTSAQKPRNPQPQPQQVPKTQQPFRMVKNPPIPVIPKPAFTVATHEQYFDVESFIKNDLLQLNEEQTKLQQQIRNIHLANKEKVKQVQAKYQIRTNYKTSANLIKKLNDQPIEDIPTNTYTNIYNLNQDMIEDSIQRLDDLLIKKQIKQKEKTQISEQSNIKSIINPFSKPEQLHKQILQLAENISKFQSQPNQQVKGYGYQRKIKTKQPKKQQIPEQISVSRNIEQQKLKPQPEPKKNLKMPTPPMLQYSSKNSQLIEIDLENQYYDPEDSLETMKKEKIQVNQKLRNILFD